ncbi:MAG: hypothetical protein JRJ19_10340 [Deltaproteobacteria bacterium]|nr:hypothetical protein [Deltaproteobacteria bacterium]
MRLMIIVICGLLAVTLAGPVFAQEAEAAKETKPETKPEAKPEAAKKASVKKLDPIDFIAKHLGVIMRIVKKGKKRNPAECKKIVRRVKAYAKKIKPACEKVKKTLKAMPKKDMKKMDKKGFRVMGRLVKKYDPVITEFGEKCWPQFHGLEGAIDGLFSTVKHKHGQSCSH